MDSCPNELKPYEEAFKLKENRRDSENWQLGQYILASIGSAFSKNGKYPKEPLFQMGTSESNGYQESHEEVAIFEMKQRIKILEKQGLPQSPI